MIDDREKLDQEKDSKTDRHKDVEGERKIKEGGQTDRHSDRQTDKSRKSDEYIDRHIYVDRQMR